MHTDKYRWIFRFLSVFICVHLCLYCFAAHASWRVTPVSSLQKLTAVSPGVLEPYKSEPVVLRAVRGEWENFQIVVRAHEKRLENVELILSDLTAFAPLKMGDKPETFSSDNIYLFWENYVY